MLHDNKFMEIRSEAQTAGPYIQNVALSFILETAVRTMLL